MKTPGQCEIKCDGKTWHFYFGIDATCEFLHLHKDDSGKDLPLHRFADPFIENESKALIDIFYCALLVGDTRKELPAELSRETFGRWIDRAEEGSFATLLAAYTTSKPLGK